MTEEPSPPAPSLRRSVGSRLPSVTGTYKLNEAGEPVAGLCR